MARESFIGRAAGSQRRGRKASLTARMLGCGAAMWTPPARLSLLAASLALAPACGLFGSDGVRLPVQLVTQACSGPAPLEGATHLQLRVTGEGMEPRELLVPVGAPPQALEDVPAGPARVLEVRAYRDRPAAGGQVLALGRSAPFDVSGESPAPARVTLRRVNAFTPASDAEHPEVCVSLAAARAGHSATLLADGRVFIAGGFALEGEATRGARQRRAVRARQRRRLAGACACARGHARAALLPQREPAALGPGAARGRRGSHSARGRAALRPGAGHATRRSALQAARSRHAAAVDAGGRVLLAGGVGEREAAVAGAEGLLPEAGQSVPVSVPLARAGAAGLALPGGELLAVAGGSEGGSLAPDAPLLRFDGSAFVSAGPPVQLLQPRRDAALALLGAPATHPRCWAASTRRRRSRAAERALATTELLPPRPAARRGPGPTSRRARSPVR